MEQKPNPLGNIETKSEMKESVKRMLEIIENNSDIVFIAGGRGNVRNEPEGETEGFNGSYFDNKLKKMIFDQNLTFLDSNQGGRTAQMNEKKRYSRI